MNNKYSSKSHGGFNHWIMQKITAIALIPMAIWFLFAILQIAQNPIIYMPIFFSYWFNAVMSILFLSTALYHGTIGLQVIFEDYISSKASRFFYINFIRFLSIFIAIAVNITIIKLYVQNQLGI
jgi:succinate dehydrogenase / fumarate reductase membrane anchor subunit